MKKSAALVTLAFVTSGALAQTAVIEDEIPEIRRYTVEMIIFSYAQDVSAGSEIFVPDLPPPLDPDDLPGVESDMALQSVPEVIAEPEEELELLEEPRKYEIVMLAEEDFQLTDTYERLQRLDAYEPLLHFGWTQPTYPEEDTEARPLSSFVTPPAGLEGELSLYLSRYLHLAVKLQLDAADSEPLDRQVASNSFADSYTDFGNETVSYPVRYRIDEDRIFRNGELRYFDHPKFGVLAKISRVEDDEPEEEILEDGELLGDIELIDGQ
jgi:hypothetical protein